jgi:hypothetical protein
VKDGFLLLQGQALLILRGSPTNGKSNKRIKARLLIINFENSFFMFPSISFPISDCK